MTSQIITKIKKIEKELQELEDMLGDKLHKKKVASLGGILKGIEITEEDIEKAKKSLFIVT